MSKTSENRFGSMALLALSPRLKSDLNAMEIIFENIQYLLNYFTETFQNHLVIQMKSNMKKNRKKKEFELSL